MNQHHDAPWHDAETLERLYVGKGLSTGEIGDRFGVQAQTIRKWLNRHGIERPREWDDPEALRELYHEKKLSQREIAERFGFSTATPIRNAMRRYGIEIRDASKRQRLSKSKGPASFGTESRGYERWQVMVDREQLKVYVHRLLAVSEFGSDAVRDKVVHHRNEVPWDNRPENIELLGIAEHGRLHAAKSKTWGKWGGA